MAILYGGVNHKKCVPIKNIVPIKYICSFPRFMNKFSFIPIVFSATSNSYLFWMKISILEGLVDKVTLISFGYMLENLSRIIKTYINITGELVDFPEWGHGTVIQVKCNI